MVIEVLKDTLLDTLRLLPFLFITYLAMEFLEHKAQDKTVAILYRSGRFGPVLGGILGILPQCGFSAAASGLYAGRVITLGTLLAVYLSTSDEMLPILLSYRADPGLILRILLVKVGVGMAAGLLVDLLVSKEAGQEKKWHIHHMCEQEHCHCQEKSIWYSAVVHTAQIFYFLFLVTLGLNIITTVFGLEDLMQRANANPLASILVCGLVGLIPNCASSVAITQLYVQGVLSLGCLYAGLLSCGGIGLLVLFRTNRSGRENIRIVGLLYGVSVLAGLLIEFFAG